MRLSLPLVTGLAQHRSLAEPTEGRPRPWPWLHFLPLQGSPLLYSGFKNKPSHGLFVVAVAPVTKKKEATHELGKDL